MTGQDELFQKAMSKGHSAAWDQLWDKAAVSYRAALTEIPDHPKALSSLARLPAFCSTDILFSRSMI